MTRRHLDIILATGGALLALLILGLGLVARNQANFAERTVTTQLSEQLIFFKEESKLTDSERQNPGTVKYAGQQLTTGKQAEAYAAYIGGHLKDQATTAGYPGATYASIGAVQTELRTKVAQAKAANDPAAADLEKQLAAVNALRENQFKGETLRGMLLTSYGFSIFGERAAPGGTIAFGLAAVLALVSAAGFVHALVTPKDQPVLGGRLAPAQASMN